MVDWHISFFVFCFIVLDVATGFAQAVANKCIDSTIMRNGLFHKMGFIFAMLLAYVCDFASTWLNLGFEIPIIESVAVFICLTELVSILENISKLTPELSNSKFLAFFNQNKEKD